MVNITGLPVEIVEAIADVVLSASLDNISDLANFRTTCKYVDNILVPRVLSTITLDLSDWKKAPRLIRMAAKPTRVHVFARSLNIKCLAPNTEKDRLAPDIVIERDGSFRYLGRSKKEDVVQATQIISLYLEKFLSHFHSLEIVEWDTHAFDPPEANLVVMDMLCSQKDLRSVCVDMSRDLVYPFPQLGRLSNLSELSVTFPRTHIQAGPIFACLAEALRLNLSLVNLQIKFQPDYQHEDIGERSKIYEQLGLLHNVRKLSLQAAALPDLSKFSTFTGVASLTSLEIRPEYGTEGLGQVWNDLGRKGIRLKNICFNMLDMETAFVQYLSSYSGVEELWLSNTEKYWVNRSLNHTALATGFFDAIVENHRHSLQVLEMYRFSDLATWGNVPGRVDKLTRLQALRRLRLELRKDEVESIKVTNSIDCHRLRGLLGTPTRISAVPPPVRASNQQTLYRYWGLTDTDGGLAP